MLSCLSLETDFRGYVLGNENRIVRLIEGRDAEKRRYKCVSILALCPQSIRFLFLAPSAAFITMVLKNLVTAFVALAVAAVTAVAQTDLSSCDFVFVPDVPVDPAVTNVVGDFNFSE